jgi:tryptophanyl-tRNA synthetase
MSKSYNNSIYLSDSSDEVMQKLRGAKTDPNRIRRDDFGDPDICLIYDYHKEMSSQEDIDRIGLECRAGTIGCFDCKKICHSSIDTLLEPMRQRRTALNDDDIDLIIKQGDQKASIQAKTKMIQVNKAIFEINN